MDILQEKWYGGLPCFKLATEIAQPQPLGVAAVTGQHFTLNLMLTFKNLASFI
jgi:ionotropic glutamate receptor NMDA 3A